MPVQKNTCGALYKAESLKRQTKTATNAENNHEQQLGLPIDPKSRLNPI